MKKNIALFVFYTFSLATYSQSFSIANEGMNILYAGIDNPISFAVEKIATKSLVIKTNNGVIKKDLENYIIVPATYGTAEISLFKIVNRKEILIGSKYFRVKRMPLPIFKIGNGNKIMSVPQIANQYYVRGEFDDDYKVEIEKFNVTIVSKDTSITSITFTNNSNTIEAKISKAFFLLQKGDMVVFTEIYANAPWEKNIKLEDVFITIY
jgi:hypothetical protein